MPQGALKRWDAEKGFGYLEPANGGGDVFCHVPALVGGKGSARRGDLYRFEVTYDERGCIERAVDAGRTPCAHHNICGMRVVVGDPSCSTLSAM